MPEAATSIAQVIARMKEIGRELPPSDGVAAFNRLYLAVTEAVARATREGAFEDVAYVRRLDVGFANLYFEALRGRPPRAWAPLLAARRRRDVLPLQFALAGMNAHINRDLPVALVQVHGERGGAPKRGSAEQRDFRRVNALLAEVERRVRPSLVTGIAADLDVALAHVDDVVGMWKVERARDAAWVNGEALWALRGSARLSSDFVRTLDRMVGFAGRGLLRPLR